MKRSVFVTEMPGHIRSGALAVGGRRLGWIIFMWMRESAHQDLTFSRITDGSNCTSTVRNMICLLEIRSVIV